METLYFFIQKDFGIFLAFEMGALWRSYGENISFWFGIINAVRVGLIYSFQKQ